MNEYVVNCPPDDVDRMISIYEDRLKDVQENLSRLWELKALDSFYGKRRFDVV